MTTVSKTLYSASYIGTSATEIFEASGKTIKVEAATATNVSASDVTITVYATGGSETPGASNTIVSAQRVRPGDAYLLPELTAQTFESGQSLHALCSSANSVVFRVSGLEMS